jgi:NDP-sugar pyrophosphorylase family protein
MKVLIPLAGRGKRFLDAGYKIPKPLIVVDGYPIIEHIVKNFSNEDDFVFAINEEQEKETDIVGVLKKIVPRSEIITIPYKKEGPLYGLRSMESHIGDEEEVIVNYCDFSWVWDYNDFKKKVFENKCDGAVACYRGFHPHLLGPNNYATLDADGLWMKEIKEKYSWHKSKMDDWSSSGTYYFKKGKYLKKYMYEIEKKPEWKINNEFYVSQLFQLMKEDNLNIFIYEIPFMLQWGTPEDLEEYLYWSDYFRQKKNSIKRGIKHDMSVVIPMAGLGKRFQDEGYSLPKPMINVEGIPMFIQAASALPEGSKYIFIMREELAQRKDIRESVQQEFKSAQIVKVNYLTEGQACTVLLAEKDFEPDSPLMIGACDNGMVYDFEKFDEMTSSDSNVDAIIFTFRNNPTVKRNPKMYGWVSVDNTGKALKVSVKIPISNNPVKDHAVVGSFWVRKGKYFIDNAKEMIKANDRTNNEFYIDTCMNYLIKNNLNVHVFELDKYICWGTPNDLGTYEYWNRYFSLNKLNSMDVKEIKL